MLRPKRGMEGKVERAMRSSYQASSHEIRSLINRAMLVFAEVVVVLYLVIISASALGRVSFSPRSAFSLGVMGDTL